MEIPVKILNQALAQSVAPHTHSRLDQMLSDLERSSLDEFLQNEPSRTVTLGDSNIRALILGTLPAFRNNEQDFIAHVAAVIASQRAYLVKGIANVDLRAILLFLMVNCYLKVDIADLLPSSGLEETNVKGISAAMAGQLARVEIRPIALPDAPDHEKEILEDALLGFEQNDIARAYRIVKAVEMTRGVRFNYLYALLMGLLFEINFRSFLSTLAKKSNIFAFVFYLNRFSKPWLLRIGSNSLVTDKWLNFEIIRQIERQLQKGFITSDLQTIQDILIRIRQADADFCKQVVRYFDNSLVINSAAGRYLYYASDTEIAEWITQCYPVNAHHLNVKARTALVNHFAGAGPDPRLFLLLSIIHGLWKTFLDQAVVTGEVHLSELILTDYCEVIPGYYDHITDQEVIDRMWELINLINDIDSYWVKSAAHQGNIFWIYHSALYLISFAYKTKNLRNTSLETAYMAILDHPIHLSRYAKKDYPAAFKKATENIKH